MYHSNDSSVWKNRCLQQGVLIVDDYATFYWHKENIL